MLKIRFPNESSARQGQLVLGLQDALTNIDGIGTVQIHKANEASQDAGTILTIVLAAPAVIAAVKAIQHWATRNNQSNFEFENSNGDKIIVTNLDSEDASRAIRALVAGG